MNVLEKKDKSGSLLSASGFRFGSEGNSSRIQHGLIYEQKIPNVYTFYLSQVKEVLRFAGETEDQCIYMTLPAPCLSNEKFRIWKSKNDTPKAVTERFKGVSASNPSTEILLSLSPSGLNVMVASRKESWFISPLNTKDNTYMVYRESDLLGRNS